MTKERNDVEQVGLHIEEADAGSLSDEERAEAADIRADIEETREEMGGTLNELGDRLDPGQLVQQAKDNVHDATIGRVEETAKGMSDMVMETIKRNPIPAAMAGAGLALLWMNRSNGNGASRSGDYRAYGSAGQYGYRGDYGYGRSDRGGPDIGDKVGDVAGNIGDRVGGAAGTVRDGAEEAVGTIAQGAGQAVDEVGWRVDRFMQASPLAVGAIAIGAGVLAGTLVPETEPERQVLGDASRQVADTVRQTVGEVAGKAEKTMDETEQKITAPSA